MVSDVRRPSGAAPIPSAAPGRPSSAEALRALDAQLAATPELGDRLGLLAALTAHRRELTCALEAQRAALAGWREAHGGLDSMRRLGAAGGKALGNLLQGEWKVWEGTKSVATDAEALGPAPQRKALAELSARLRETDAALAQVRAGGALPAGPFHDWRLTELARPTSGPDALAKLAQGRLAGLSDAARAKDVPLALELREAVGALYRGAPGADGSVDALASGAPSPTAAVNRLVGAGLLGEGQRRVSTAQELSKLLPAVEGLRKERGQKGLLGLLTPKALEREVGRLEALEKSGSLAPLQKALGEADEKLAALEKAVEPGLFQRTLAGVGQVLDSPETWAMVAVGFATSGVGARAVLGERAVSFSTLAKAWRDGNAAAPLVGRFAAGQAADAVVFQTAMNGFNHLRGKPERAGWRASDYARSIVLFETLGFVGAKAAARAPAATKLGRAGAAGRRFAEEAGALTLVGVGEKLLREGSLDGAAEHLEDNLQFLAAMRLVGAARAGLASRSAAQRELAGLEARVSEADARYREAPSRENLEAAYAQFRAYAARYTELLPGADAPVASAVGPRPALAGLEQLRDSLAQEGATARSQAVAGLIGQLRGAGPAAQWQDGLTQALEGASPAQIRALRRLSEQAALEFGELAHVQQRRLGGQRSDVGVLAQLFSGEAARPTTFAELEVTRAQLSEARERVTAAADYALAGRSAQALAAQEPARFSREWLPLQRELRQLEARERALDVDAARLAKEAAAPPPTPLEELVALHEAGLNARQAAYEAKGEPVPERLLAQRAAMERVAQLTRDGESLPVRELGRMLDSLLVDMNPAELTFLRDALITAHRARGELGHLPKGRVPGMPARVSQVASLLVGTTRTPTTPAETRRALADVAAAREALPEGAPERARLDAREKELRSKGPPSALGGELPTRPKAIERKQAELTRELGRVRAALAQAPEPAARKALAEAEAAQVEALQTLREVAQQVSTVRQRGRLDGSGFMLGGIFGHQVIPNFAAISSESGLKVDAKDPISGRRTVGPFITAGAGTSVGGVGYFFSKAERGGTGSLTFPFMGFGRNPVMGRTFFVYVPGVFGFMIGSSGSAAGYLTAPPVLPGVFVAPSAWVKSPVLSNVTGPALAGVDAAVGGVKRGARALDPALGPVVRPVTARAKAEAGAVGQGVGSVLSEHAAPATRVGVGTLRETFARAREAEGSPWARLRLGAAQARAAAREAELQRSISLAVAEHAPAEPA